PGRACALFLERRGAHARGARRVLRQALRRPVQRAGEAGSRELPERAVSLSRFGGYDMSAQTRRFGVVASVLIAAGGAGEALADGQPAPKPGERKSFVACPMVRNTYVPCWLAEYEGELYYLGVQGDLNAEFYPPQLGHKALIEGTVSDGPRICGGIVLEPVHVSVLPELTPSCNTILPDEGHASPPYHRTPGPNNSEREERADRGPDLPARPPAEGVTFIVPFEFDVGERLYSRDSRIVTMDARYARDVGASRIKVTG